MANVETPEEFDLALGHGFESFACSMGHVTLGLIEAWIGAPIHLWQPPLRRRLLGVILASCLVPGEVMLIAVALPTLVRTLA